MTRKTVVLALVAAMSTGYAGIANAQDGKDATIQPRGSTATAPANTPESNIGAGSRESMRSSSDSSGMNAASGASTGTTIAPHSVIGWPVMNRAGNEIGTVDGIVRDRRTMENYALVDVGDFLSVSDRKILVPLDSLRVGANNSILMSQGDTRADLQRVPKWDRAAGSYDVRVGDATRPENELRWGADPVVDSGAKPDHTDDSGASGNNSNGTNQ